jgi:Mce-associated membrane protein
VSRRHRMPRGTAKSDKETTDVPNDTVTPEESPTDETVETSADSADVSARASTATEVVEAPTEASAEAPTEVAEVPTEVVEVSDEAADFPEDSAETSTESAEDSTDESEPVRIKRQTNWPRVLAYGVLPGLALLLALAAGFSRWEYVSSDYGALPPAASEQNPSPAFESINAAKDSTIKMLSYKPESVDQQLNSARDLLTGEFRDSYTSLINDVVIPGAKQKQISAVASVPAAASVSADPKNAVVLVFVNQTVVVGQDPPSDTASSVRVTLEKVDDRWLISEFEPV